MNKIKILFSVCVCVFYFNKFLFKLAMYKSRHKIKNKKFRFDE